ncbi:putative odorant receptor 83c [Ochlerotatus camptorhynchus]|uniref:putative odorant receptor 83c n=1 Tax=Ochlerotatus camptorhynchus TaxID=644619 RepID=UPI0031D8BFE9
MERFKRYFNKRKIELKEEFYSPRTMYESACDTLIGYFHVSGADRLRADYTPWNPRLVFLVADLTLYILVNCWCLTVFWGQLTDVVFCLVTMGIAIQGFAKIANYTDDRLYELHVYNVERFDKVRDYPEARESLETTAVLCKVFIKLFCTMFMMLTTFIPIYTVVYSVSTKTLQLPFGFFFPWIDHSNLFGYLINLSYHFLQIYEACYGLLATDTCFLFFIMHAIGQLDILIIYLRKLDELALNYDKIKIDQDIYRLLDDIAEKHQEHMEYMSKLDSLLKPGFFVNFSCLIAETVASLYVQSTTGGIWYPGLIVVLLCVVQLFIACALGTIYSTKNDQLVEEIYNVSWYALPIPAQKSLTLILHSSQHPVVLSDGFDAIDLFAFVQIYKKIYTYFTMLQSFN